MRISIYYKPDEHAVTIAELVRYAQERKWSISRAIMDILDDKLMSLPNGIIAKEKALILDKKKYEDSRNDVKNWVNNSPKNPIADNKIDPEAFFAQMEAKALKSTDMEQCIKEKTNANGEISCYFFDNAREHYSFCKQFCWARSDLWRNRVRK